MAHDLEYEMECLDEQLVILEDCEGATSTNTPNNEDEAIGYFPPDDEDEDKDEDVIRVAQHTRHIVSTHQTHSYWY